MPARRTFLLVFVLLGAGLLGSLPREHAPGAFAVPAPDAQTDGEDAAAQAAEDAELPAEDPDAPALPEVPSRIDDPPLPKVVGLDLEADLLGRAVPGEDGRLVALHEGVLRTLTVMPGLQDTLTGVLQRYQTPYAAVAVVEVETGRVLALSEHAQARPGLRGLPVKAAFPAASVFKIVTGAALLEEGLSASDVTCSHGGFRKVTAAHLSDSAKDRECFTLGRAMGLSVNGVFAKRTVKHLDAKALLDVAGRFGFNRTFDFPLPVEPSLAAIPEEPLSLAQAGAGFGDVFLSPLHAALLAAVPATGGLLRAPLLFEDEEAPEPSRAVAPEHAEALADMLEDTVTHGTARRIFRERGFAVKGAVGKTGSLADKRPFRDYSWFVGYAPKDAPKVAVAAVIVNDPLWRIRATWLGREALRHALKLRAEAEEAALEMLPVAEVTLPRPASEPASVSAVQPLPDGAQGSTEAKVSDARP